MTDKRPIKVKLSLNKFRITVLTSPVIIPTSLVTLVINFPECLLSIDLVSALIKEENIST